MIRLCHHIYGTNFYSLSIEAKMVWLYAATRANRHGLVEIHLEVLPRLAGLDEAQSKDVIDELSRHNFYDDDQPPFLSKYETPNWSVSEVLLWECRYCEVASREHIPNEIRQEVLEIGICVHCGRKDNLEVDHIRPVSLGGSSDRENLQPLCERCNRRKLNRFIG